jgi:hypothetical protein
VRLGSHHDAQFDGYEGSWSLISVVTPLPPTVLPLDGPANVPSGGDQTVNLGWPLAQKIADPTLVRP